MRFVYALVRFVPDPLRGEFVNVGAIAGSEESSDWSVRQIDNPTRARAVDVRKSLDAVWAFMGQVGARIDAQADAVEGLFASEQPLSEGWLSRLFEEHRNVVQLSPPAPMIAASAEEALDRVFEHLIFDPAHRRFRFKKKHLALAAVRQAYRSHHIGRETYLREQVSLATRFHQTRLDFAVTNGRVLQVTHTWSFQVPDQAMLAEQVKAWGWTMKDAREFGGRVRLSGGGEFELPKDFDAEVVYVPPEPGQDAPAFDDARHVFEAVGVRARTTDDADAVAVIAERLLVQSGHRLDPGAERRGGPAADDPDAER